MVSALNYPSLGGTETHIIETSKRLAARGHQVTNLTCDKFGELKKTEILEEVEIRRFKAYPKNADLYFSPKLIKELEYLSADIIHIQGIHTFVTPMALLKLRNSRIPVVLSFHSGGHSSQVRRTIRSVQFKAISRLLSPVKKAIAVSEFERNYFQEMFGNYAPPIDIVPNGIETIETLRIEKVVQSGNPIIVSAGRLVKYKGHHRLIEAISHLKGEFPNIKVHIVGEGPYKANLLRLIERLGLSNYITIESFSRNERQELFSLIGSANLMVLLSDYEAHPVSILEACALGVPSLVLDSTGLHDLVKDDFAYPVASKAASYEIATRVKEILKSKLLQKGPAQLTWDNTVDKMLEIYEEVISQ
ncbi:MAG: glycosyltransferase family 4 protein [Acidimicrobiales bacterium]|nr:glycosyltransferase family 4 protein [Acidimicrobiales bacterium]